jgi:hypothetical protein
MFCAVGIHARTTAFGETIRGGGASQDSVRRGAPTAAWKTCGADFVFVTGCGFGGLSGRF